jgi:hypothetical protein
VLVAGVKFLNHAASGLILCSFSLKLCTFAEERSFVLDALTILLGPAYKLKCFYTFMAVCEKSIFLFSGQEYPVII